jgi:Helix-turn-helix domain
MSYSHLSTTERFTLYQYRTIDALTMAEIAVKMKRSKSTISFSPPPQNLFQRHNRSHFLPLPPPIRGCKPKPSKFPADLKSAHYSQSLSAKMYGKPLFQGFRMAVHCDMVFRTFLA